MGSITIDSNIMTQGYRGGFSRSVTSSSSYYMYFPSISYNTIIGRATSSSYQYGIALGSVYNAPGNYRSNYDVVIRWSATNLIFKSPPITVVEYG
jgi:hypothetical protein